VIHGGIVNDNIVFPVLDLIRKEMKEFGLDHGIPSVKLYRDHPMDDEIVTAAELTYESGLVEEVILIRGSDDESTYPEGLKPNHPDYEYCKYWRLTSVTISYYNKGMNFQQRYEIKLNYDKRGLLASTVVIKI
jgi:hypothetical protein